MPKFNRSQFTRGLTTLNNSPALITNLVEFAIYNAINGNTKESTELFNSPALLLKSGSFNALGKRVLAYYSAHYKALKITPSTDGTSVEFSAKITENATDSGTIRRTMIVDITATQSLDEGHELNNGDTLGDYIYQSKNLYTTDLSKLLSFAEFDNLAKPEKAPSTAYSVKALAAALPKLASAELQVKGTPDELRAVIEQLHILHAACYAELEAQASAVDLQALQTFETLAPSTLAKAANKKAAKQ